MARLFTGLLGRGRRAVSGEASPRDFLAEEIRRRKRRAAAGHADLTDVGAEQFPAVALAVRDPLGVSVRGVRSIDRTDGCDTHGIPDELRDGIEPAALRVLTPGLARELGVLPFRIDASAVCFATAREPTRKLQTEVRWIMGLSSDRSRDAVFVRVGAALLEQCLDVHYPASGGEGLIPQHADLLRMFRADGIGIDPILRPAGAGGVATVRALVDGVLLKAVYRGASDVLFECFESEFRIRYKVEGICELAITPLPPSAAGQVVSVIKQHARLDIAETERSQDGRFDMKIESRGEIRSIQFRVAVRPTINGESCVIRLHDNAERRTRLDDVGADPRSRAAFLRIRDHRNGLVLFSGPTGSGKTTTLAAILGECDSVRENIVTIEDPVEIRLPGVTQSAVNEIKGETCARLLRNAMRFAPDRLLVGEVRDAETAQLVVKGALTGHQVLTTVHADDAARAVTRMLEEQVSPFNLSSVLTLVVAQRLLNRLCEHCAVEVVYPFDVLDREQFAIGEYGAIRSREGRGCSMCHHRGTYGRIPIYETLVVTEEIRDVVAARPPDMEAVIRRLGVRGGMRPLRRWGLDLVRDGLVALHQVIEITPPMPADLLGEVAVFDGEAVGAGGVR